MSQPLTPNIATHQPAYTTWPPAVVDTGLRDAPSAVAQCRVVHGDALPVDLRGEPPRAAAAQPRSDRQKRRKFDGWMDGCVVYINENIKMVEAGIVVNASTSQMMVVRVFGDLS